MLDLVSTKPLLGIIAALVVGLSTVGLLYKNVRSQLALSESRCSEAQYAEVAAGNEVTQQLETKSLRDEVTQLRSALERRDAVAEAAVVRAKAAEKSLAAFRRAQEGQGKQDENYASWAGGRVPDGVAARLRAIQNADPSYAGRSD